MTLESVSPAPEPTLECWRARVLLAQSLISHRMDPENNPDLAVVLEVLRGHLTVLGPQ